MRDAAAPSGSETQEAVSIADPPEGDYDFQVISFGRFPEVPTRFELLGRATAEALRKMTPQERMELGFEAFRAMQRMLNAHLTASHPEWTSSEVEREVAQRISLGS